MRIDASIDGKTLLPIVYTIIHSGLWFRLGVQDPQTEHQRSLQFSFPYLKGRERPATFEIHVHSNFAVYMQGEESKRISRPAQGWSQQALCEALPAQGTYRHITYIWDPDISYGDFMGLMNLVESCKGYSWASSPVLQIRAR